MDDLRLDATELGIITDFRMRALSTAGILMSVLRTKQQEESREAIRVLAGPMCVGAVFSLWRAAPLVHKRHKVQDNITVSTEYLEKIIRHNTVSYADDVNSTVWTFGYYFNNARFRIMLINRRVPKICESAHRMGYGEFLTEDWVPSKAPFAEALMSEAPLTRLKKGIEVIELIVESLNAELAP